MQSPLGCNHWEPDRFRTYHVNIGNRVQMLMEVCGKSRFYMPELGIFPFFMSMDNVRQVSNKDEDSAFRVRVWYLEGKNGHEYGTIHVDGGRDDTWFIVVGGMVEPFSCLPSLFLTKEEFPSFQVGKKYSIWIRSFARLSERTSIKITIRSKETEDVYQVDNGRRIEAREDGWCLVQGREGYYIERFASTQRAVYPIG